MKPYWSDYVAHMIRFYLSGNVPATGVDKKNYSAVSSCVDDYPEWLLDFYREPFALTKRQWRILKEFEKEVARKRGLV